MKHSTPFTYRNWNFKKKILVIISALIIFFVMLVSMINYVLYSKNYNKQTVNQTQQIIEQVGINVDTYLEELFRLNLSPYYNDEIMGELEDEYTTRTSSLYRKRIIENFLASVMTLPRSEILRVYILTDDNLYSYTRTPYDMEDYDDYANTDWYQRAMASSAPVFVPIHSEKAFGDKKTQIFSIAQRIRSKEDNSKVLAVIKVDANYTGIKSICDQVQLREKGSLFIMDGNRNIVYQNNQLDNKDLINSINIGIYDKDGDFTEIIDSKKYIINIASLDSTDMKVIAVNSYDELNKSARTIRNTTILFALLCMVLAVSILFVFVQSFFKPLFHIIHKMKKVQEGDLTIQVEVVNNDEIGDLATSFNNMIDHLSDIMNKNTQLVKEVYESRYLQKEAQYNILCSQIKPHFLYNTLNTISLLIKCKDSEGAVLSIEQLSYFLRGIMSSDKNIRLSVEIGIVNSYLRLQKARYGNDLSYQIDLTPEYSDYIIPALTLQPIVENAIIHGCEMKRGKSILHIFSSCDDQYLYLHVEDNGVGIDEVKLNHLNLELQAVLSLGEIESEDASISESIGLINVNKRIKLKYGDNYGIHIESALSKGTQVTINLPLPQNQE